MSERVAGFLVTVAIAWTAASAPLAAQDPFLAPEERARLEAEFERIQARIAALADLERKVSESAEERADAAQMEHVSESVGPVVLRGTPAMLEAATPDLRRALDGLESTLGDLAFLPTLRIELFDRLVVGRRVPEAAAREGWRQVAVEREHLEEPLRTLLGEHVLASIPGPVGGAWSGGLAWSPAFRPADGLRSLARSTDADGVACVQAADRAACFRFLHLAYDGTLASTLAALERAFPADLFTESGEVRRGRGAPRALARCVERSARRADADPHAHCLEDLARSEATALGHLPASSAARASIVAHALRLNEGDGITRLMALPAGATVGDQLAALAGVSIDELVDSWRDDVSFGRGLFEDAGDTRPGPVSLFWAGGLALLALRSTRWRLG